MEEIAAWVGRITWSCGTFLFTAFASWWNFNVWLLKIDRLNGYNRWPRKFKLVSSYFYPTRQTQYAACYYKLLRCIYYLLVGGMSLIQLVLLRCVVIYWGSINTFYLKNKMLYAKEKLLWYNPWQSPSWIIN